MKHMLLIFLYSTITLAGVSQDSTISFSKFEIFSSQPGKILRTETAEIGSTGQWTIRKLRTTDVATGNNAYAIKIDNNYYNNITSIIDPNTIYIDSDELDSVISVLTYFTGKSNTQKTNDLNYSYFTSTDIKVYCYYSKDSDDWRFGMGKVYHNLHSSVPGSFITFNKKRTTELINLLNRAKIIKL